MFLQKKKYEKWDGEETTPLSTSPGWQRLLLLSVFCCSHTPDPHVLHCHKYTSSNVRTDLLCPLERKQSKSVFEPNNDNKQQ